ncbi:hypothetical protein H0H81_006099 [Sphagnurus paluster]|uniref:F-box domain-containing protein n=1 Tax=Sphagnurus paluster TaxID=117069 RepID=A0A9P7KJL4_9AGAR|nr:hypothetical protein H0H81_006099 [Sphagnurus paluster]
MTLTGTLSQTQLTERINACLNDKYKLLAVLDALDGSINSLRAELARRKNEESITARLPTEILAKIFEVVYYSWKPKRRRCSVEMTLAQVSSRWRSVAISISALWCNIHVSIARPTGSLQAYLYRSKSRPLSVTFDLRDGDGFALSSAWPSILEHSSRWRRLTIKSDSIKLLHRTLGSLRDLSAPTLEELAIQCDDNNEDGDGPTELDGFHILLGGAPRLRRFCLDGISRLEHSLDLSTVDTLFIHNIQASWPFTEFRPLMASLSCLTHLSINHNFLATEPLPDQRLVIPTLHTLRLRYHPQEASYEDVLMGFVTPSLEALHLVNACEADIDNLLDTLTDVSAAPNLPVSATLLPKLNSLVLDGCSLAPDVFRVLASRFPSVKHLTCVQWIRPTFEMLLASQYFWQELSSVYLTEALTDLPKLDVHSLRLLRHPLDVLVDQNKASTSRQMPRVFFAELSSFKISRELEFMRFPFEFPRWQIVF